MYESREYIDIENFKNARVEPCIKNSDSYVMIPVFATLVDMWIENIKERVYSDKNPFLMAAVKEMYHLPRYVLVAKNERVDIFSDPINLSDDSSVDYYITRRLYLKGNTVAKSIVVKDFEEFSKDVDLKDLFKKATCKVSHVDIPFEMYHYLDSSIKDMICDRCQ